MTGSQHARTEHRGKPDDTEEHWQLADDPHDGEPLHGGLPDTPHAVAIIAAALALVAIAAAIGMLLLPI